LLWSLQIYGTILKSAFHDARIPVSDALLNTSKSELEVILAVNAVAFRPTIIVHEDGQIEGLTDLTRFTLDRYEQLVGHPQVFEHCLRDHWADAYSALLFFSFNQLTQPFIVESFT
jgi:hypothetical protein